MVPLQIIFYGQQIEIGAAILRFPNLKLGAPYQFSLSVRFEDETYRQWTMQGVRWRIKLRPGDKHELMVLTMANGNFVVTGDTLEFRIAVSDWANVVIPQSTNHLELDYPFAHVIEFLDSDSNVTERFAQGSGLITTNLDF